MKFTLSRLSRNWSSAELRQLRALALLGTPLQSIALELRRTKSAVRNKAAMHGISLKGLAQERAASGFSQTQLRA